VDKGTVVISEVSSLSGLRAVAYFGDDAGDLPAFRALSALAEQAVDVARVAVRDPEGPPELVRDADVVVDDPSHVLVLLRRMAEGLKPEETEPMREEAGGDAD
jgi:trehalose 6-phosphate phosphatase